jgi:hypothetical protein
MWDVAIGTANIARRQPSLSKEGQMTTPIPSHHHGSPVTRRGILIGASATLICAPTIVRSTSPMAVRSFRGPIGPQYAGFVERLFYHALDSNLRTGRMSTVCNGEIVVADARRLVAHAWAQGWLAKSGETFHVSWGG